jgi:hypothetical protein
MTVTVNLEDVAGVKTLRSTLHDSKGAAFAVARSVVEEPHLRDIILAGHLLDIAKYITTHGVPNDVQPTETPDTGTQGNRATEAVGEDPARSARPD